MKLYKAMILLILMTSLTGCNVYKDRSESYQIYNLVLNQLAKDFAMSFPNSKGFLIERRTSIISLHYRQLDREGNLFVLKHYINTENGIKQETFDNYVSKNKRSIYLEEKHLRGKYVLLDRKDVNRYMKVEPDIYDKYRGYIGLCTFSRIGFNTDKTQAVLFCEVIDSAIFVILNKRNNQWIIDNMWAVALEGPAPNILR